ncbi:hypothetical protein Q8A73_006560 [Channa argus]|nr:hypothetical protein Q8A73_006560 [Channa argus]
MELSGDGAEVKLGEPQRNRFPSQESATYLYTPSICFYGGAARSEGMLLVDAVSRVTKAPFYTTGVQRMGHSTVVLLGSAPVCISWISDLPLCLQQTPPLVGMFFYPSLAEITERPRAPGAAFKTSLERINDHTTYAKLGESHALC